MEVLVEKITAFDLMNECCGTTLGKGATAPDPFRMYKAEHSPIRTQEFRVRMIGIPTFVSVHLVRHKFGVEHFVKSNREDRPGFTGDGGRDHPVNHDMVLNAQALISMARKRLCYHAHEKTQEVMRLIRARVADVDPALAQAMVPDCVYRGNICFELKFCGKRANVHHFMAASMRALEEVQ